MYSVVNPESNFGGFSRMVPEWFRKRSIYRLRIYWGKLMGIQFPVAVSAKVCVIHLYCSKITSGGSAKCLDEYVSFPHISSITRSWDFRKVYVCAPYTAV